MAIIFDDEESGILRKPRLSKHFRVSKYYEKFSRKDTFEMKGGAAANYGTSAMQYKVNGSLYLNVDYEESLVGKT